MSSSKKGVYIISFTYPPDVGGVETHLENLVEELRKEHAVYVSTYKPIVTDIKEYQKKETKENLVVHRYWWFGGNLFRKLESSPLLLFLYITPYLLLRSFLFLFWNSKKVDVIHVHGLNSAFIGVILSRMFRKRVVMQTHALYSFQRTSLMARVARWVLNKMDAIVTLCTASKQELLDIGVSPALVHDYRYWIDLDRFADRDKAEAKAHLGWENAFTILFVGRLIDIKGADIVVRLAESVPDVQFVIIGDGPDKENVIHKAQTRKNLRYEGLVPNKDLGVYYNAADVAIVPSQYPEGFGRVICESLASGTPVIASNVGGIPDAMDETVGILCEREYHAYEDAVTTLSRDRRRYRAMRKKARAYAEEHFACKNSGQITKHYFTSE